MKPCAQPNCPALATRGDYCQVHARRDTVKQSLDGRPCGCAASGELFESVSAEETRAAIETRKRIARLYHHEDR